MIRLLAVCFALTWMIGCQYQPRTPVYDPFAAAGQRIAPPPTGSLNQPGGYLQQAPAYSQAPAYLQPQYAQPAPAYPQYGAPAYQPPAAYQVPAISQPQIPPGFVPKTSAIPAVLSPVSRTASSTTNSYVSSNRNVPTPKATANWPPRKRIRQAEVLSWNTPGVGGVQRASANTPIYSQSAQSVVQPTVFWNDQCVNCDPYSTPHIVNPLLPQPAVYAEAHQDHSNVTYAADQSYSNNWRARSNRRE